jgi:hypothetical protein
LSIQDIPARPTLRDLYQLVATLGQQIQNQGQDIQALREDMTRQVRHQQDDILANAAAIKRIDVDLARLRIEVESMKAWQMTHAFTCPFTGMSSRTAVRANIQHLLHQLFDMAELNALAFNLGIRGDDLKGETLAARAQELVLHCERRSLVNKLLELCRQQRPEATWPLAYE